MHWCSVAAVLVGLALGGCAAAVPGYTPPDPKLDKYKVLKPRGGGFDADGRYHLTEQEEALGCKSLTGSMIIKILQMREAQGRVKPSGAAVLAGGVARPVMGGTTYGSNLAEDLSRDRLRLEAFNAQLARKGCDTFDLASDLKAGNTTRPRPTKRGR